MDRFALILVILGALVWGAVGIFGLNPVAWLVNGSKISVLARIIYTIIGLGGLWCIKLLFRERTLVSHHE
jgi:uncharacterized membrane protein YuzA (DUF378 family)